MTVGYQPFAITAFNTGQFQYLQPWIRPDDAFDPLVNAFVFRGVLSKRLGSRIFGETGLLRYQNNETVDVGDGTSAYSGILSNFPIEEGSVTITVETSGGRETYTDDGLGVLTGDLGGTGTIVYSTGVWSIDATPNTVAASIPIVAQYTFTARSASLIRPIMMIAEFADEITNEKSLVVADTRRAAVFNSSTELFDPIQSISHQLFVANPGVTTTGALSIGFTNIAPYSVTIIAVSANGATTETITDVPTSSTNGGFTSQGNLNPANNSTINYATGVVTINFTNYAANAPAFFEITANFNGDYFTGTFRNLFNYVNWRPREDDQSNLIMTNNVDRVTTYDGNGLSRPPLSITLANLNTWTNEISRALDVKVLRESLVLIRPTTVGNAFPDAQMIRTSAPGTLRNFVADVRGNGFFTVASTGDWIMSASYLRDVLVVDFEDSTFIFRFSGNIQEPFVFQRINVTKATNAPYGSIEYDDVTTSMGAKGLCQCDGVTKDRYDLEAIDLYEDIDENNFDICQGKRFDLAQQSWMIYPSDERVTASNTNCDKVIVYNWIEGTWSTYKIPLSCLGSARTYKDTTWNSFGNQTWVQQNNSWNSFSSQDLVPWMLGGDTGGYVYLLNEGDFDNYTDVANRRIIESRVVSKRWNPFKEQGQKATFGYVDFYYKTGRNSSTVDNPDGAEIKLNLSWFVNNSVSPALSQSMTLDSPVGTNEEWALKRMYLNLTGQFLRLEIESTPFASEQVQFQIAGIVLWAKPAGRFTPGTFL